LGPESFTAAPIIPDSKNLASLRAGEWRGGKEGGEGGGII
jgi:hypothetical protein